MKYERINEPTPSGGAYSVARFYDQDGNLVEKADAYKVVITEYTKDDKWIFDTIGYIRHT